MWFALILAQAKAPEGGEAPSPILNFMPIILMVLLGYFLLFRPMRQQEKQRQFMVSQLKKNDKVVTQAGIIGTVARIDDDEVFLKIDENSNVRLRVTKSSVARVLTSSSRPADDDKDKDKDEGTTDEDITARPRS